MDTPAARDLGVDVLIIGGTLQAAYLASALHPQYSVCVLDDPDLGPETLSDVGYLSAGYEGNDPNRVQPARRAASWWAQWARAEHLVELGDDPWCILPAEQEQLRRRVWDDAALVHEPSALLPEVLGTGDLRNHRAFRIPMDVVVDPGALLERVRAPVLDRHVRGKFVRFSMFGDTTIDAVEIEVRGERVLVVPRYVVAASDAGNATLLRALGARFSDAERRRSASSVASTSQAVHCRDVLALRGDLPMLHGWIDRLHVVSHRLGDDVVWLVSPPLDVQRSDLGPVDLRFDPTPDDVTVAVTVERLVRLAPGIADRLGSLHWAAWGRRETQHPVAAEPSTERVGHPVPARLETLGLEDFLALWPSHPAYSMILGDLAAERITVALGASAAFSDAIEPSDLGSWVERSPCSSWRSDQIEWHSWDAFVGRFGITLVG